MLVGLGFFFIFGVKIQNVCVGGGGGGFRKIPKLCALYRKAGWLGLEIR
jgi:hypothetical protein